MELGSAMGRPGGLHLTARSLRFLPERLLLVSYSRRRRPAALSHGVPKAHVLKRQRWRRVCSFSTGSPQRRRSRGSRRYNLACRKLNRRGQASGGGEGGDEREEREEEEAVVRSRLAKRAAAARRIGRKLAFVSFNLEVLVFVYAFWRARRRSLSWRLPTQALPMLMVPALATLIYAAFVCFTRTLDLKDKKRLERLQEDKRQTDGEPREFDQDDQNNVQNCDGVDDASLFTGFVTRNNWEETRFFFQPELVTPSYSFWMIILLFSSAEVFLFSHGSVQLCHFVS